VRRQAGKRWPWTTDPILRKYKFCQVFRELDAVTIWIRETWREPYEDHPHLWFAMAVARQINWPDTLAEISFPDPWRPKRVARVIHDRIARGQKAFTSAYRGPLPHKGNCTRGQYVAHEVLDPLYHNPPALHRAGL
jgi:5-hmdU DNA kinase, helical domain